MKSKVMGKTTYFYAENGKEIAQTSNDPETKMKDFGVLYIMTDRLQLPKRYDPEWFKKPYLERARPEYKKDIEELLKLYEGHPISDYFYA